MDGTVRTLAQRVLDGHFAAPHSDLYTWAAGCPAVYVADGSGVGAYADPSAQCSGGVSGLTTLSSKFESVGLTLPSYISGVCVESDRLSMVRHLGFSSVGGVVGWCARTMSESVLTTYGSDYSVIHGGSCTGPATCHQQMPYEAHRKMQPWKTSDVTDWLREDSYGAVTLIPTIGDPRCQYELASGTEDGAGACSYSYTDKDLEAFFERLDEAVVAAEDGRDRVLVLTLSVGSAITADDETRYGEWARRVQAEYLSTGKASWGSMLQAAEAAR